MLSTCSSMAFSCFSSAACHSRHLRLDFNGGVSLCELARLQGEQVCSQALLVQGRKGSVPKGLCYWTGLCLDS